MKHRNEASHRGLAQRACLAGLGLCATTDAGSTWQRLYRGGGGLTTNTIADLAVDSKGHLWVATNNIRELGSPGGVYRYTPSKGTWRHWGTSDGLSGDDAMVVAAGSDVLWFGVSGHGLDGFAPNWQAPGGEPSGIEALASTSGLLWVGSSTQGVWKYNGTTWTQYTTSNSGLGGNNISALAVVPENRIWAGTANNGVSYFNGSTWTAYKTNNSDLVDNRVRALALDANYRPPILMRAGHHCAIPACRALGVYERYGGTVRASFHYYNTPEEVEAALRAIRKLAST